MGSLHCVFKIQGFMQLAADRILGMLERALAPSLSMGKQLTD
jgi:hypothetical protein